jgi:cytochrome c oxidase cbb3-type subunit 1
MALAVSAAVSITGLFLAGAGAGELMESQGWIIMIYGLACLFYVINGLHEPEPPASRLSSYYDDPTKAAIFLSMAWAILGMFMGVWIAALLAYPEWTFDAAWASFGRLRPSHTTGVIFGFGGNALIGTSLHVMQRTTRARLPGQFSPWFVLIGYNLFCLLAVAGYFAGITQSKEYAEPEWYADIWLVIVWVTYFLLYMRTLWRRNEPHIYVSNWYYLAFILVVAVLHIVNNLALPISLMGAGRHDAMVVRAQCRGLLPDGRLPRDADLLPAEKGGTPDLFLPHVNSGVLGHYILLYVGRISPSAFHGLAPMGADSGHDILCHVDRSVMDSGCKCPADPQRRLAQGQG